MVIKKNLNLPIINEPFDIIGKAIITYDGTFHYQEELSDRITTKVYPNEAIENTTTYYVLENNEVVGSIVLTNDFLNNGYIENISVNRDYRNQGIGTQLMNQAVLWCKENHLNYLKLETQDNNVYACRFYLKYGFHISGIDTKKYLNSEYEDETAIYFYYKI